METCQHCGTVLPKTPGARYCPNCGEMSAQGSAEVSDPTQAYAAVGASGQGAPGVPGVPSAPPERGMTWELPAPDAATQAIPAQGFPAQGMPTQAIPAQSAPPEPDPFAHLYRPEGGAARPNPNATQVMQPVPADYGRAEYEQPAYDQPIDYQAGGGGAYAEPYEGGYADDYPGEPGHEPRSNRGAKIGIGVAAAAVLVIVVSLITLGGNSSTPSAGPANAPGSVTTPTGTPSSAPSSAADVPSTSAPSSSATSPTQHTPGQLQLGDTGPEVKWLQNRLHQLHIYNGPISGTFDAPTQAAVAAFQARTHPSDPSGVVGRSTKTALIAAGSKPTLTPQIQMPGLPGLPGGDKHHKGDNPGDVTRLQQALAVALNTNLKASGQYDTETFGAVVEYAAENGLPADGVVNGQFWAALQAGRIKG